VPESRPLIARGIGERTRGGADLPSFAMVLANPLKGVSTPEVFRRLATRQSAAWLGRADQDRATGSRLKGCATIWNRRPARCCRRSAISAMLEAPKAASVRMSGSGATCFGIFAERRLLPRGGGALHGKRPTGIFRRRKRLAGDAMMAGSTKTDPSFPSALRC
jgi:4-diphosphocytidyl-2-C-methyl-D-erythritol kinase